MSYILSVFYRWGNATELSSKVRQCLAQIRQSKFTEWEKKLGLKARAVWIQNLCLNHCTKELIKGKQTKITAQIKTNQFWVRFKDRKTGINTSHEFWFCYQDQFSAFFFLLSRTLTLIRHFSTWKLIYLDSVVKVPNVSCKISILGNQLKN